MKIGCIVMASGLSARFGSNKLLATINGRSLIQIIIDNTTDILSDAEVKRLVLTRTEEVYLYCSEREIPVILHKLPNRNDAVKLGIEQMTDCDACVFCASDQPRLQKTSIQKLIEAYRQGGAGIYRLSFGGKAGNPILFSKEYFEALGNLPEKKGGAYLASIYPEMVRYVEADNEWELADVDTPEDLKNLI